MQRVRGVVRRCGGAEGAEGADLQRVAEAAAQPRREAADEANLQRKEGTAVHGAQVRRCVHVQRCGGTEVQRRRRRTVSTKIASLPSERWARRECVSSDAKSTSDTRPLRLGRGASRSCGRARTGLGRSAESVGALRRSRRRVGGDRSRSPPAARSCPRSCSPRERSAASAAPRPRRARAPCRAARWSGPRPRSASAAGGCASASARSASRAAPGRMRLG